tara:strand:+ start:99 stop:551 length:453 start_codon:yes stop_codon:yes gene_type:complete
MEIIILIIIIILFNVIERQVGEGFFITHFFLIVVFMGIGGSLRWVGLDNGITIAIQIIGFISVAIWMRRLDEIEKEQIEQRYGKSKLEKQKTNPTEIKESQNIEVQQPKPSQGIEKKDSIEESNDSNSTLDLKTRASNLRKGLDELRKSL